MRTLTFMLTLDDLRSHIETGQVETVLVVFPDLYGRLVGKRVTGSFFLEETVDGGMHACDYLLTVDMEMDVVEGYDFANWQKGYGDVHCVPDWSTLRLVDWLENSALVFCDLHRGSGHEPVAIAPRTLLRQQVDRLAAAGFKSQAASELEYYLFKDSYDEAREKKYDGDLLSTAGAYIEDYHMLAATRSEGYHGAVRRHMSASGIPVESSKGEWGPGQHEVNFRHGEALETADRAALFKHGCKEIALQQDCSVTFMAKWRADLAGSSAHLHISLWDEAGTTNLFAHPDSGDGSDVFRHFLGGWMTHARAITPFYAPNPNSYKRYVYQSWAPTAIAWSRDNRTAGFRVVGKGSSLRIESRIPGSDSNPYLALAATLAAGLDGIQQRIEPPVEFVGDVYDGADLPRVPDNLAEATAELSASTMLREAFGDDVVEHYLHFFRTEQRKFDETVTNWERARYFERG
ncbi:MAG TPA: glutamine synthetase family protein [Candidatus Latescibacteria bacterium]|nr:glutamine synthetase family protein [Candidatus Latescibacterota bacterium]